MRFFSYDFNGVRPHLFTYLLLRWLPSLISLQYRLINELNFFKFKFIMLPTIVMQSGFLQILITLKNQAHVLCIYSLIHPLEPCNPFQQMNKDMIIVFVQFSVIILISKRAMFLQDVAVKVLSIQDFSDDQLKEFLREVYACLYVILFTVNFCLFNLSLLLLLLLFLR